MTITPTSKEREALDLYEDEPLEDGDTVFMLDEDTVLEIEGLAAVWEPADAEQLARVLRRSRRVVVGIARQGSDLQPRDYELTGLLRSVLERDGVEVLPLQALPAS